MMKGDCETTRAAAFSSINHNATKKNKATPQVAKRAAQFATENQVENSTLQKSKPSLTKNNKLDNNYNYNSVAQKFIDKLGDSEVNPAKASSRVQFDPHFTKSEKLDPSIYHAVTKRVPEGTRYYRVSALTALDRASPWETEYKAKFFPNSFTLSARSNSRGEAEVSFEARGSFGSIEPTVGSSYNSRSFDFDGGQERSFPMARHPATRHVGTLTRSQQDISGRPPMYPNSRVNKQTSTGSYRRSYSGSVNDVMGFERSSLNDVRGGGRGYERSRTNQDVSFDQQQQFSTPIIRISSADTLDSTPSAPNMPGCPCPAASKNRHPPTSSKPSTPILIEAAKHPVVICVPKCEIDLSHCEERMGEEDACRTFKQEMQRRLMCMRDTADLCHSNRSWYGEATEMQNRNLKKVAPPIFPSTINEKFYRSYQSASRNQTSKKNSLGATSRKPPPPRRSSYQPNAMPRRSLLEPTKSQLMKRKSRNSNSNADNSVGSRSSIIESAKSRPDVRTYTRLYSQNSRLVNGKEQPIQRRESTQDITPTASRPNYEQVSAKVDSNLPPRKYSRAKSGGPSLKSQSNGTETKKEPQPNVQSNQRQQSMGSQNIPNRNQRPNEPKQHAEIRDMPINPNKNRRTIGSKPNTSTARQNPQQERKLSLPNGSNKEKNPAKQLQIQRAAQGQTRSSKNSIVQSIPSHAEVQPNNSNVRNEELQTPLMEDSPSMGSTPRHEEIKDIPMRPPSESKPPVARPQSNHSNASSIPPLNMPTSASQSETPGRQSQMAQPNSSTTNEKTNSEGARSQMGPESRNEFIEYLSPTDVPAIEEFTPPASPGVNRVVITKTTTRRHIERTIIHKMKQKDESKSPNNEQVSANNEDEVCPCSDDKEFHIGEEGNEKEIVPNNASDSANNEDEVCPCSDDKEFHIGDQGNENEIVPKRQETSQELGDTQEMYIRQSPEKSKNVNQEPGPVKNPRNFHGKPVPAKQPEMEQEPELGSPSRPMEAYSNRIHEETQPMRQPSSSGWHSIRGTPLTRTPSRDASRNSNNDSGNRSSRAFYKHPPPNGRNVINEPQMSRNQRETVNSIYQHPDNSDMMRVASQKQDNAEVVNGYINPQNNYQEVVNSVYEPQNNNQAVSPVVMQRNSRNSRPQSLSQEERTPSAMAEIMQPDIYNNQNRGSRLDQRQSLMKESFHGGPNEFRYTSPSPAARSQRGSLSSYRGSFGNPHDNRSNLSSRSSSDYRSRPQSRADSALRQSGSRLRGDSLPAVDYQNIRARPVDENHFIAGEPQPQIPSRNNSSSYSSKSVIKSKDFDVGSASEKIMNSQGSQSEPVELNIPDAIQEAETPRETVPEPESRDQLATGEQSVMDSGFEVNDHDIDNNGNSMVDNEQFKTAQILEVQQNTPREQANEDGEQFEHVEEMQENNKKVEDLNENEIEIERVKNNITEREFFENDQAFQMSNNVQFQQQRQQGFQNQQKWNQRQEKCENWQRNNLENEVFSEQNDTPGFSHAENGDNENFEHIESDFQNDLKNQQMLQRENIQFAHAERDGRFQQKQNAAFRRERNGQLETDVQFKNEEEGYLEYDYNSPNVNQNHEFQAERVQGHNVQEGSNFKAEQKFQQSALQQSSHRQHAQGFQMQEQSQRRQHHQQTFQQASSNQRYRFEQNRRQDVRPQDFDRAPPKKEKTIPEVSPEISEAFNPIDEKPDQEPMSSGRRDPGIEDDYEDEPKTIDRDGHPTDQEERDPPEQEAEEAISEPEEGEIAVPSEEERKNQSSGLELANIKDTKYVITRSEEWTIKVNSDGKPELTSSQGSVESFERKKAKVDQLFEAVKHSVENAGQRAFKYTQQKEERINEVSMVRTYHGEAAIQLTQPQGQNKEEEPESTQNQINVQDQDVSPVPSEAAEGTNEECWESGNSNMAYMHPLNQDMEVSTSQQSGVSAEQFERASLRSSKGSIRKMQ